MKRQLTLILPLSVLLASACAHADIVVNEVLGSTSGADAEYIELYNSGSEAMGIGGWSIALWDSDAGSAFGTADDGSPFFIDAGVVLAPGEYYLLANELAESVFEVNADSLLPDAIENSSYTLVLNDELGEVRDIVFVTDGGDGDAANIAGNPVDDVVTIGPDGSFLPAGFTRVPDGGDAFQILAFNIPDASQTPMGQGSTPPPPTEFVSIMAIQGAAHVSPLDGQNVDTRGVVTAVAGNGFYLQDVEGDGDDATSDALFVFTSSAPDVTVGDLLEVSGRVSEYTPGGSSTRNLSTTQISNASFTFTGTAALPAPVVLGAGGRAIPTENIDDDAFATFDPQNSGLDLLESVEAMRVQVNQALVVGPTNRFGEIFTVADQGALATGLSTRQTLNISPEDFNPERLQVEVNEAILPGFDLPMVDSGVLIDEVVGVVSFNFGNFEIYPTQAFSVAASGIQPEVTHLSVDEHTLSIASYNVLNLDPNDNDGDTDIADGRFAAIAQQIVDSLGAPDIIGLQEIQDNDGSNDTEETSASVTLQMLSDAVVAAGGPAYAWIDTEGLVPGSVGGQPGGNIRVAFLYNPERVSQIGQAQPLADPALQASDFMNPFFGSRISLAADFDFNGATISVINNHLSSKGGSAPIMGTVQPFEELQEDVNVNGSLDERQLQSAAVNDAVQQLLAADTGANVVVLGDMNEFEFISPVRDNLGASLTNLTDGVDENERYSFIFQGNSQSLDHLLVSDALVERSQFDIVHVNAEFAETDQRASDHDPLLVTLQFDGDEPVESLADLNGDGETDHKDYRVFLKAYGMTVRDRKYNPAADFDSNGRVNRRDLLAFLDAYRQVLDTMTFGDVNRDGKVDHKDLKLVTRKIGTRAGDRKYLPDADLDRNNRINRRDQKLLEQVLIGA